MRSPLGAPKLMWSFNRDGECDEALRRDRDAVMDIDTAKKRTERRAFVELAHPQHGVDAMADAFTATTPIPGVKDVHDVTER